jgi:hypothetical protein
LKYNKSLTSFNYYLTNWRDFLPPEQKVRVDEISAELFQHNKTLREFCYAEVHENRESFMKNKIAISAFVKIFAKNVAKFSELLPMELWLRIAYYLESPGITDVKAILLETIERYQQRPSDKM